MRSAGPTISRLRSCIAAAIDEQSMTGQITFSICSGIRQNSFHQDKGILAKSTTNKLPKLNN